MERQKIWICIGIAFLLLFAVSAAILFSASEDRIDRGARFVSATEDSTTGGSSHAFGQDPETGVLCL